MEVWWAGFTTHPLRLHLRSRHLLLGYNRYSGLRCDASPAEVAIDSVEEMGLGLIAAFVLWLLGQITFDMTVNEIGKIIMKMTVAMASPSVPPS